jgi:hypothetical protein
MKVRVLLVLFVSCFPPTPLPKTAAASRSLADNSYIGYYYYPAYSGPWTLSDFNWMGSFSRCRIDTPRGS